MSTPSEPVTYTMQRADLARSERSAELQLALSHTDYDIFATHFWSERNVVCDRLSRVPEGEQVPGSLVAVPRTQAARRRWRLLPAMIEYGLVNHFPSR